MDEKGRGRGWTSTGGQRFSLVPLESSRAARGWLPLLVSTTARKIGTVRPRD